MRYYQSDDQVMKDMLRTLTVLLEPGQVTELCVRRNGGGASTGYFSSPTELVRVASSYDGDASILAIPNPVNPDLLARAVNRMKVQKNQTKDEEVERRRWLVVGIAPVRPAGIAATKEEKEQAAKVRDEIRESLKEQGWTAPIVASAGSGYHLLFRIDLANDDQSKALVKEVLESLSRRFGNDRVKVDTSAYRAAHRIELYGSVSVEGDGTKERPHRRTKILHAPDEVEILASDKMKEFVASSSPLGQSKDDAGEETQAQTILRKAESAKLFCDKHGEAFVEFDVNEHCEVCRVKDRRFKQWLTASYYDEKGKPPSSEAVAQAIGYLEAKAAFQDCEKEVALRVGQANGRIYYDLCDRKWRAVKVTKKGYTICKPGRVAFQRTKNMGSQVEPEEGGTLDLILKYINIADPEEQVLFLCYLVTCLVPGIPHAIAIFSGQQGSAKTTALRVIKAVVDPSMLSVLSMPKALDDLALHLSKSWMPAFDNLSTISGEQSNLLCQAVTGGGMSRRSLYQNDEETIFEVKRCPVFSGINVVATQPDLLDRCVIFELTRLGKTERRPEKEFWEAFERDRPLIVGALFDTLSKAMAIHPTLSLKRLERMADMTVWGYAAAKALGFGGNRFLRAYRANLERGTRQAIENSPVAMAMLAMMENREGWSGSMTDLHCQLGKCAEQNNINTKNHKWPKSAAILSRRLKEVEANLAQVGIQYHTRHNTKGAHVEIVTQTTNARRRRRR